MSLSAPHDDFLPAPARAVTPYLLLVLAIFTAYGNIFDNAFLFDDDLLITLNSHLTGWHFLPQILTGSTTSGAHIMGGFFRPMQMFLYLCVKQITGGAALWFHLLNLTIHIANACLMFRIGEKLKFNLWGVFLASLVWGVHTLHTEAVTYMSATADPLFAFFCLLSVSILLPDITPRKIWLIFPLFLLGLLSKETMAMFPLLVTVCLFYINPKPLSPRIYLRTWPLWVVTVIFVIWRSHAEGLDGPQTYDRFYNLPAYANLKLYADHPIYRLYTFFATLPSYADLLLWPHDLHMERAFTVYTDFFLRPVVTGFAMVCLAIVPLVRSVRHPQQSRHLSWGILWFFAAHAPDTGILIPMNSLFLEHWMYLPAVGLFLGSAESVARFCATRKMVGYGCGIVTLGFAAWLATLTYNQNQTWKTPESFYTNIFSHGEVSARSRNNLALYYAQLGRYEDASAQFAEATKITDTYAETRYNMAINYLSMPDHQNHIQQAIDCLNRSLEIDPKFYRSYQLLSEIYKGILNDPAKAESYHARAVALTPKP